MQWTAQTLLSDQPETRPVESQIITPEIDPRQEWIIFGVVKTI